MNLVLLGYRGSGKSTIGKILARRLGMRYVGFDDEIVRRAGMSIPEIVDKYSWDHFRRLESAVVHDFSSGDGQILDTGGGVILRKENTQKLRNSGKVFLLESEISDIADRIGSSQERPSLTGSKSFLDEIEEVFKARQPLYQEASDFVVNTSKLNPEEAADLIVSRFRKAVQDEDR
jgi:shikimate kinase